MKVLHIISGGETGGSRKHVITLLEQFDKDEICLLLFQDGSFAEEAKAKGIPVKILAQKSRYDVRILSRLAAFIQEGKFDIVHSHGPRANLFMSFIKNKVPAVWVTTIHSDPKLDFMKGGLKGKIFTSLNLKAIRKIDAFFAVSEPFKENLAALGIPKDRIMTIYNGIEFAEPLKPDGSLQQELGLKQEDFVMTMVARMHPIKGHDIVLQALKQNNNPRMHLVLVGDGPIKGEVEKQASELGVSEQVHFLGFRKDIPSIYSNSHIGLLASHSESFPLALLEAANEKLPLISTDVGGVKQLISEERFGWVVPIGDKEAYAAAMAAAFRKHEEGQLHPGGEALYEHASRNFSLQALAETMKEHYIELAKKY